MVDTPVEYRSQNIYMLLECISIYGQEEPKFKKGKKEECCLLFCMWDQDEYKRQLCSG